MGEEDVNIVPDVGKTGSVTFEKTGDDARTIVVENPSKTDFTSANNFVTGGYQVSTDTNDGVDYSVVEPTFSDVSLYLSSAEDTEVTNGQVTTEQSSLTVNPDYNFGSADRLEITIKDSSGVEITGDLVDTSSQYIEKASGDYYYTGTADTTFQLTNLGTLDQEQYNVTLTGDELDSASHTVSFTIGDADPSISLDKTSVVQGEKVVGTVTGSPGENVFVRVDSSNLLDRLDASNITQVFDDTGDVVDRTYDSANNTVVAEIELGEDATGQVRIDTQYVEEDSTITVEVSDTRYGEADEEVDLEVTEMEMTVGDAPSVVPVSTDFTINGTAQEAEQVGAYVKVGETWHKIPGETNPDDDLSSGTYEVELTASDELAIPGSYRIGLYATTDASATYDSTYSEDQWQNFETTTSTSIRTVEGNLSAQLSRSTIADVSGNEVTLFGAAVGQEDVYVYRVGPRGATSGNIQAESISVDDDEQTYEKDLSNFRQQGQWNLIVVGSGRDGDLSADPQSLINNISNSATQKQAVEVILDEHTGAGVDDAIARANLTVESPSLEITSPTGTVPQGEVTVSGTTNLGPDTTVFVEITNPDTGDIVASGQADVTMSGTWNTTVSLADAEVGTTYRVNAEAEDSSASTMIEVVEETDTTTTTTPSDTTTTTTTTTGTTTTTTTTAAPTTTTTNGGTPGFGVMVSSSHSSVLRFSCSAARTKAH
ncbi:hypothetical protein [Halospeciosus flavus]|uniref:hypothetical protein n=1 Tax=Halospeciosus flavus TaxID=3032283 RepID=UPI003612DB9D